MARILFLVKRRSGYWGYSDGGLYSGTGLWNSARFVVEMLVGLGIEAKIVEVIDNNDIDREVTAYQPTHCILEAFWVVPAKFDALRPLHPTVRWIVRDHSETAFLALEGSPFAWLPGLIERGVEIMCNSPRAQADMQTIARDLGVPAARVGEVVTYGPNYYPLAPFHPLSPRQAPANDNEPLNIACFGAIRPLKNQMAQAIAALDFAQRIGGRDFRFHVNAGRVENGAEPALTSMRGILGSRLVEHPWMVHADFVALMATMDLSLQVSFSETFNIVSADAVQAMVPVVVSPEISWLGSYARSDPTSSPAIAAAMVRAWQQRASRTAAQWAELSASNTKAAAIWYERFKTAEVAPRPVPLLPRRGAAA